LLNGHTKRLVGLLARRFGLLQVPALFLFGPLLCFLGFPPCVCFGKTMLLHLLVWLVIFRLCGCLSAPPLK
jgi:hypothetical protein